MEMVVDKLIEFSGGSDDELRDISALGTCQWLQKDSQTVNSCLALKTITAELPADGKVAASACAKLTPKLLEQVANVRNLIFPDLIN
jgi:cullin-associated NEDD8-dissociated protein 1